MIEYVAGFLFDNEREHVALIHKTHGPNAVVGRWNGIGGKIAPGESNDAAMEREFAEEAGVSIQSWCRFMRLKGNGWHVDFYHAFSDEGLWSARTAESEVVGTFEVSDLPENIVPNLRWIIPMALGHLDDNVVVYEVEESVLA